MTSSDLDVVKAKNARLAEALRDARDQITEMRRRTEAMSRPPRLQVTVLESATSTQGMSRQGMSEQGASHDGNPGELVVFNAGRIQRVAVGPDLDPATVGVGQTVELNEAMVAVAAGDYQRIGEVMIVKERYPDDRVLVATKADDEHVVRLAGCLTQSTLRVGDVVTVDTRAGLVLDILPSPEIAELVLEEVPDVTYQDVGGLDAQIAAIRDAVELPFAHPELYRKYGLRPPHGILLYGPPGCGKTLIAKAVANALHSCFLNVKGPELLNKYVGETERHIRVIFSRAREKAAQGMPVVVFFDEMEALFRRRGSGVSSDVETTIVPQILAEIDGVERLDNVIVIGASNREDMIDPAVLRSGRLDVKIRIERPDRDGARAIFRRYLTADTPVNGVTPDQLIDVAVDRIWDSDAAGVVSGAMIRSIVDRAKTAAIKEALKEPAHGGTSGLTTEHILQGCAEEFQQNEDLALS
ncbi:MAG: proteasome ATPase [Cellulomonadaceae bacterium]|jgi:proteasome-associated ATPase|nr:proteasome ATPase [Cellulomonadaceae bacterium]